MPYRFATTEIENAVAAMETAIADYRTKIPAIVNAIAGYLEVYSPDSGIEIRYITSNGRDNEKWRGALLAQSPNQSKVNVWTITVNLSQMLAPGQGEAVGSFDKPFSIGIDYYYDYEFGTDLNNSETFFNAKIDGFEYILEQIRTCLPLGAEIESGMFKRMIVRFTNASTHCAKGDFAIKIEGL